MDAERREFVHGLWASVADEWVARADYLEVRGALIAKPILERAAIVTTDRVLALADGAGGMGLAAAALAAQVVSSDVVPAMVDGARQRAAERGVTNLTARVIDIESIDEPDASFDAVLSREGLMFAVDQQAAFDEIARVLRPGGRLAAAVWGLPRDNPWLSIVIEAVSDAVGHPVPPPGMPGPFALCDEDRISALLDRAGLVDGTIERIDVPFHAPSFDDWWDHTTALAGPVANIIRGFDEPTTEGLLARMRERVAPYVNADGIELPGVSLLVSAKKP